MCRHPVTIEPEEVRKPRGDTAPQHAVLRHGVLRQHIVQELTFDSALRRGHPVGWLESQARAQALESGVILATMGQPLPGV